jgi:hypothetical protein
MGSPGIKLTDDTIAAILKDYAARVPIAQIVKRHEVSTSIIYRYVNLHGINRSAGRLPLTCCVDCGVTTRAASGVCRDCRTEVALPDGDWVLNPRTRVMVWEPAIERVAA